MEIDTNSEKINRLLTRGVEEIFVKESLQNKLCSGRELRVKLGFDPTSPYVHIGRAVVLWKLREFQELGHKIIFIVGDFTALIGDPSDKLEKRPALTAEQIKENTKYYKKQVGKIIDIKKAEFKFNSRWLKKLNFSDVAELAECFSVQQMSHRRNFADRMEKGEEISLREFLYPLMQGYDSVEVKADVELGGFDQLFNLKAGRIIQKHYGQPEQDIMAGAMLPGTDGRKMSSSWGNVINILDKPGDMYGKIMSIRDDLIIKYFTLCTRLPEEEISKIEEGLKGGENPRDIKMRLAREIVALYYSEKKARVAEKNFIKTFRNRGVPEEIKTVHAAAGCALADILVEEKIISSKSDWWRLVEGGGIEINGSVVKDARVVVSGEQLVRIGKKRFVKIISN